MRFKDQVAIVTGAASGIGKAIAIKFAQEGATCRYMRPGRSQLYHITSLHA